MNKNKIVCKYVEFILSTPKDIIEQIPKLESINKKVTLNTYICKLSRWKNNSLN